MRQVIAATDITPCQYPHRDLHFRTILAVSPVSVIQSSFLISCLNFRPDASTPGFGSPHGRYGHGDNTPANLAQLAQSRSLILP